VRVSLVNADIPYFKVKGDEWDRQWKTEGAFLGWVNSLCGLLTQILLPNGSLYLYASPQMARKVGNVVAGHFNVLNEIRWTKEAGWHNKTDKEAIRSYLSPWESIIFAEQKGAGGSSPLGARIRVAREAVGLKATDIDVRLGYVRRKDPMRGTELCRRWEEGASVPSEGDFCRALAVCGENADYTELREQYERLRRPFTVTAAEAYTDVWDFPAVLDYAGKHPCEKPPAMMRHIVLASSREGDTLLDLCAGSGVFGEQALAHGRKVIAIEREERWARKARARAARYVGAPIINMQPSARVIPTPPLFDI
jgi:adenine-specific DNA-methyltransferase